MKNKIHWFDIQIRSIRVLNILLDIIKINTYIGNIISLVVDLWTVFTEYVLLPISIFYIHKLFVYLLFVCCGTVLLINKYQHNKSEENRNQMSTKRIDYQCQTIIISTQYQFQNRFKGAYGKLLVEHTMASKTTFYQMLQFYFCKKNLDSV